MSFEEIKRIYENAGFKEFSDLTKQKYYDTYLCSFQKRVDHELGKMFFVNVTIWDMREITRGEVRIVQELDVQFHTGNDLECDAINITRIVRSPEEAEAVTYKMWKALNCGYYETRGW